MAQKIDKREISEDEADRILQIEESHYIDLKAVETEPGTYQRRFPLFQTPQAENFTLVSMKKLSVAKRFAHGAASKTLRRLMIGLQPSNACRHSEIIIALNF